MSETRCHYCLGELVVQLNHLINEPRRECRIFWAGNDGERYCSPKCAIETGGDPDKIRVRRNEIDSMCRGS